MPCQSSLDCKPRDQTPLSFLTLSSFFGVETIAFYIQKYTVDSIHGLALVLLQNPVYMLAAQNRCL